MEKAYIVHGVREALKSSWHVSKALVPICEIWRSSSHEEKVWIFDEIGQSLERRLKRINREALRAAGNSAVPQVVEAIGRWIVETDAAIDLATGTPKGTP